MKRRWSLLILLCLLLTGCSAEASGGQLISAAEGSGAYSEALLPFLPGYALRDGEDTLYAEVSRGNAVACFDVQAIPAMDRGVGRYWYPHVSATVVLAVDRTRTDAVVTGWNSLREKQGPRGHEQHLHCAQYACFGGTVLWAEPKGTFKERSS